MGDLWNNLKDYAKAAIPFAGGGLSFLGGLLTNESNADIARANRHFVRNMYKKRYQFTMDDMRKAGLNPVLAANGGSVGSVPSISTPTMSNALEAGVSGALSTARAVSDIQAQQVSNSKTEADQKLSEANTKNVNARTFNQDISNGILSRSEEALVRDAQARATNNTALATLNEARSEYAKSMALAEQEAKIYRVLNLNQDQYLKGIKGKMLQKSPEYTMSAAEQRWMKRIKAGADVLGKGVNSAVGVGKLRWLFR